MQRDIRNPNQSSGTPTVVGPLAGILSEGWAPRGIRKAEMVRRYLLAESPIAEMAVVTTAIARQALQRRYGSSSEVIYRRYVRRRHASEGVAIGDALLSLGQ